MNCNNCGNTINPLRLKALPSTRVCVKCSSQDKWHVRTVISGKTEYCEIEVIKNPETAAYLQSIERKGWGSNLVKVTR
jgi:hypothetical protein